MPSRACRRRSAAAVEQSRAGRHRLPPERLDAQLALQILVELAIDAGDADADAESPAVRRRSGSTVLRT